MRSSSGQSFSQIRPLLPELLPQSPPKLGPIWSSTKKSRGIWKVKSRMVNTQKLKLVVHKLQMYADAISSVRIWVDPLGGRQGSI